MACVHDSAGRSSRVQGPAETRLTFGFLGCASVREDTQSDARREGAIWSLFDAGRRDPDVFPPVVRDRLLDDQPSVPAVPDDSERGITRKQHPPRTEDSLVVPGLSLCVSAVGESRAKRLEARTLDSLQSVSELVCASVRE
jgi:hypothetical protein